MNSRAALTVVVPCFRCTGTIERALASISSQTLVPAEVILVDDCSGDATLEKLWELQRRYGAGWVRVIALRDNGGPARARNTGWNEASHPYVAFLDADDSWLPEKVAMQFTWMLSNPLAALSCHAFPLHESPEAPVSDGSFAFRPVKIKEMLVSNRVYTSTVMVKKEIPLRFPEHKKHAEDYLLWLRMCLAGYLCFRSEAALSLRYKSTFGAGGLSGQLWKMEVGELDALRAIRVSRQIGFGWYVLAVGTSLAKFARRLAIVGGSRAALVLTRGIFR